MQASPRLSGVPDVVARIVATMDAGARLLVLDRCGARWPQLPAAWTVVPGSESRSPGERFTAYANRDAIITLRAVPGGGLDPAGRLVALVTLDGRRVAIAEAGPDRFDARWTCDGTDHRLTAGPTTLGAFMRLLTAITWR